MEGQSVKYKITSWARPRVSTSPYSPARPAARFLERSQLALAVPELFIMFL